MLKKNKLPQAIREAVDYCPGGLCFSMPDGRPILVNIQMNRLCAALTGHTVHGRRGYVDGAVRSARPRRLQKA
jgi:hypothetical protein